ncbi:DsbA family protein [Pigmentiphaga aceris]|uniref:DsbA family protein n=1 Tax=Pigmentiphaga aceris TaxID=1940612 RepID=A0A5C0AYC1_9BURK|nr:DsbA family protein [Pigmentiphaga aceris]QEI06433.1 DsbA family protein [Pigmentiphaga aceris]
MNQVRLHYVYDPLCGWCYGAAPLIDVACSLAPTQAHAGGLMVGSGRRPVTPELRNFVTPHDARIARLSGQAFGEAYRNGLLCDEGAVFDSEPPITAVLAADQIAGAGLTLLARVQTAHYVEGRRISDPHVLRELAADIGLDVSQFDHAFEQIAGDATQAHMASARAFMKQTGAYGFPALVLERDGVFSALDITAYFGQPEAWRDWLSQQINATAELASDHVRNTVQGCVQ